MRLELDDAGFHIVSLWPAWLLMDKLRRVVAIHVMGRVALAGRILALVLIAHASAAWHLAIAFALPLATWVGVSGWGCLVGLNRSQQAEDSRLTWGASRSAALTALVVSLGRGGARSFGVAVAGHFLVLLRP